MDLKKLAKTYFDNNDELKKITGTKDGHFFYESHLAVRHCVRNGIKGDDRLTTFTPESFIEVGAIEEHLTPKQKLQKEATALGIEFEEETTSKDLKIMIDLKNEE